MKTHRITGGGSTKLYVVETGNSHARPILFIHGFSQSSLAWRHQLSSDLESDFRLVAVDLRGHGFSDKPAEGYDDSKLWADDIRAVIEMLELDHPLLCSWSYGLVPLDYIRHYGDERIGGLHLVAAISKLGSEDAFSVLTRGALDAAPGLFVTDAQESERNLEAFLRLAFECPPSVEDFFMMLGYNVKVPPRVRLALFSRAVDNDDVLARIKKPVLLTHGTEDGIVKPAATERHKALMPHAEVHLMNGIGHAPFWEDPPEFNRRLRAFAESLKSEPAFA